MIPIELVEDCQGAIVELVAWIIGVCSDPGAAPNKINSGIAHFKRDERDVGGREIGA